MPTDLTCRHGVHNGVKLRQSPVGRTAEPPSHIWTFTERPRYTATPGLAKLPRCGRRDMAAVEHSRVGFQSASHRGGNRIPRRHKITAILRELFCYRQGWQGTVGEYPVRRGVAGVLSTGPGCMPSSPTWPTRLQAPGGRRRFRGRPYGLRLGRPVPGRADHAGRLGHLRPVSSRSGSGTVRSGRRPRWPCRSVGARR